MSLKNRIIEYFYPFTNNPEDFVLKCKEAWYGKFYNILYSGNGGKTFKYLLHASSPLLSYGDNVLKYNWEWREETFNPERESFSYYKDKFKSLQNIKDYHKKQYQIYLDGKEDVYKRRKKYLTRISKNIE